MTTSSFTPEAERFAETGGVQLISGVALLREIRAVRGEPLIADKGCHMIGHLTGARMWPMRIPSPIAFVPGSWLAS